MQADESSDPRVGETLHGRYKVLQRLAAGAMGVVYRGERVGLGRQVAIKFLHPMFASQPTFKERFEREALTMSRLDHPHCVSVIDLGFADAPYIVMDFVDGRDLSALLEDGPLPPRRAVELTRQILAGLAHAHEQGLVHRDIKPANIMLAEVSGKGDHVRILDFGLAKFRDTDQTMTGIVVGTPSYMSPEQAQGKRLDPRSDLYSTGVLLFQLLTGEKPFRSSETYQLIRQHIEELPPRLAEAAPGRTFSAELEAVVTRALAKSPDGRYASAQAMADALARVPELTGRPGAPVRPPPPHARTAALDATVPASAASPPPPPLAATAPASVAPPPPPPAAPRPAAAEPSPATAAAPAANAAAAPAARGSRRRLGALLALVVLGAGAIVVTTSGAGQDLLDRTRDRAGRVIGQILSPDAPDAGAPPVATLDDARALADAGELDQAISGLHELRRARPADAAVPLLLGKLYFDKDWWAEGLAAYKDAIGKDDGARADARLIADAVRALERDDTANLASELLVRAIGEPALPALRRAAAKGAPAVRTRAKQLIRDIGERSRRR